MSVLCCFNASEKIEIARALRKELNVPVVCLTSWEYIDDELDVTEAEKAAIGPFYSLAEFYYKNIKEVASYSIAELDRRQLALEKELGIANNVMVTYYDRDFCDISDYRQSRNVQYINLLLVKTILDENDFDCIYIGRETYLWQILADAALYRQIPCMSFTTARHVGQRIYGRDSMSQQFGMKQIFENLMQGNKHDYDPAALASADTHYKEFVDRPVRPQYAIKNTRSLSRCVKTLFTSGYKSIYRSIQLYWNNEFDRVSGRLDSVTAAVADWPAKAIRMYALTHTDFLQRKPDLNQKFFYLPLHKSPEVTDMYYGRDYSHHLGFVADLAKRIPSDYKIYVKDHTSMVGVRTLAFYKELKSRYNVEVINPYISTYDLMVNAQATITVTGTAGWEAYLMGRPVITLGRCFYNFLPGILHLNLRDEDFVERLTAYLQDFKSDKKERVAAIRAHYLASYDVHCDYRNMKERIKQAPVCAKILRDLHEKWGDWIVENESQARRGRMKD